MKKGYKQLIEELEDSLQAYTNYRTRAEEIIQGNLATINDLMLKLKKKEEAYDYLAKVALDCSAKQVYKIKDLQSLLEDSATKNAVRFDNSVELYAFRNNITPVDVFERISKGDNELKTIIEDIANGSK